MIKLKTRRTRSRIFNIFKTIMVYVKSIHACGGTKRKFSEIDKIDSSLVSEANLVAKFVMCDDDDDDDQELALETIKFFRRVSHLLPKGTMDELEGLYSAGYMGGDDIDVSIVNRGVDLVETLMDHKMITPGDYVKLRTKLVPITWEERLRINLLQQQTQNGQEDSQVSRKKRVCKVGAIC